MRPAIFLPALGLSILVTGCSAAAGGSGQDIVFPIHSGFSQGGPAMTSEILDIGVPLINTSAHPVHLTGITLTGTARTADVRYVIAFRNTSGSLGLTTGDMRSCPGAHSVTAVTMAPRQTWPHWYAVIAVAFPRPGHYKIRRARISYTTSGHAGWQYQNLNTYMTVTADGQPPASPTKLPVQDC